MLLKPASLAHLQVLYLLNQNTSRNVDVKATEKGNYLHFFYNLPLAFLARDNAL